MLNVVLAGAPIVAAEKDKPLTALPAVKLATDTCVVALLCTTGKVSVPAKGVVAEVSADILALVTIYFMELFWSFRR
jgi:hypothetical protein